MARNKTVDLLKFILSILIVTLHSEMFIDVSDALFWVTTQGLSRAGVPFFFVASGYFLCMNVEKGKSVRDNILRNAKVWIVFILLDLCITGWHYYPQFEDALAFFHKAFFVGLSDAYWFLPSLVVTQLIMIKVFKKQKTEYALIFGFFTYLFAMTHDSYSFLFEKSWIYPISAAHTELFVWPQAGLVESIFFVAIGGLIYKHRVRLTESLKNKVYLLRGGMVLFSILLMLEAYFTQGAGAYDGNCYLSLIFLPGFMLLWALIDNPVKYDTKTLGVLSLYIYLVHPIVVSILKMTDVDTITRAMLSIAITLAICIGFFKFKQRRTQLGAN